MLRPDAGPYDEAEQVVRRFARKVAIPDDQCWEWTGAGVCYGHIRWRGPDKGAHRVAYRLFVGPIPDGLLVRHKCDNPSCVNPMHLELGTHQDNTHDAIERGPGPGRKRLVKEAEEAELVHAYLRRDGSADDFAESRGISRRTLYRTIDRYRRRMREQK